VANTYAAPVHRIGARPNRISLAEANRDGQQLFFAGMWNPKHGHGKTPYVKTTVSADLSLLHPVSHRNWYYWTCHAI
jgi:hypothetical protein